MANRPRLVVANWKMHGSTASNAALLSALQAGLKGGSRAEVAVCVPYPYLIQTRDALAGSGVAFGAQDVSEFPLGAYTGDVASEMLLDVGASLSIVGHSERRTLYGEPDVRSAAKARRALDVGLRVVFCVGEHLEERDAGQTDAVVLRQLDALLAVVDSTQLARLAIAYEPVWAIGTGKTATPDEAQSVHQLIRGELVRKCGQAAEAVRVLYGGSVKPGNARTLFAMPDIDGGLIGGASLVADEFLAIVAAAAETME